MKTVAVAHGEVGEDAEVARGDCGLHGGHARGHDRSVARLE